MEKPHSTNSSPLGEKQNQGRWSKTEEEKETHSHVIDMDAIPLRIWEALGEETAKFIRRMLRDPDVRAEIMPEKGGEKP